jgi:hypothetical protein
MTARIPDPDWPCPYCGWWAPTADMRARHIDTHQESK